MHIMLSVYMLSIVFYINIFCQFTVEIFVSLTHTCTWNPW